jgi:type VI secretion system protein ImpF
MSSRPGEVLRHSVIDRILADGGGGRSVDLRIGVEELRRALRRDIEWLLNSKQPRLTSFAGRPECSASILNYGIPDITQFNSHSQSDRLELCRLIAAALRSFEPRLLRESIRVEFVEAAGAAGLDLHFRISGVLHVEPIHEPIAFDTSVEVETASFALKVAD